MIDDLFPVKNKIRAERRKEKIKKINRVEEIKKQYSYWLSEEQIKNWAKKNADNRQPCSCMMCSNPRKAFKKLTLQEKKAKESMKCD